VLCQRTFISVFFVQFFYAVILHSITYNFWALNTGHKISANKQNK
jgi:uncharacterized membrane protein